MGHFKASSFIFAHLATKVAHILLEALCACKIVEQDGSFWGSPEKTHARVHHRHHTRENVGMASMILPSRICIYFHYTNDQYFSSTYHTNQRNSNKKGTDARSQQLFTDLKMLRRDQQIRNLQRKLPSRQPHSQSSFSGNPTKKANCLSTHVTQSGSWLQLIAAPAILHDQ